MENSHNKRSRAFEPYKEPESSFTPSDILLSPVKFALTLVALSLLILFLFQSYFSDGWNILVWALGYVIGIPLLILADGVYAARKNEKSKLKHFFIFISIALAIATFFAAFFIYTEFPIGYFF